jgi:hypothetical protein
LYPHTVFQGQILEGIVIRFIRVGNTTEQQSLELCLQSDKILKAVPPELVSTGSSSSTTGPKALFKSSLKNIFERSKCEVASCPTPILKNKKVFSSQTSKYRSLGV